ncbi:MAG: hypothetical protein GXO79_04205 [Chlorobi bacterium]|nr:hypothetical protein [Chlorobiota bacterium]
MKKIKLSLYFFLLLVTACTIEPKPINYGVDNCAYCSMTIVDNQHAAELVTTKGKVYKFDAIECMINYLHENAIEYKFKMINDYSIPGKLINAESAVYIISKNIPSPMGAFLSAFESKDSAYKVEEQSGGNRYNWDQIQKIIVNK